MAILTSAVRFWICGQVLDVEAAEELAQVRLDRVDAQVQLGRDLLVARRRVGPAGRQARAAERLEHAPLPGGQRRRRGEARLGRRRAGSSPATGSGTRSSCARRAARRRRAAAVAPVHALLVDEGPVAREAVVLDVPARPTRASWACVRETRSSHSIGDLALRRCAR